MRKCNGTICIRPLTRPDTASNKSDQEFDYGSLQFAQGEWQRVIGAIECRQMTNSTFFRPWTKSFSGVFVTIWCHDNSRSQPLHALRRVHTGPGQLSFDQFSEWSSVGMLKSRPEQVAQIPDLLQFAASGKSLE